VLTNGSLLGLEEVQRELADADLVIPSLDAGNDATFRLVDRPHEGVSFDRMLAGLIAFRRRFRKQFWLEVFLLGGHTTSERELAGIRRCVDLIRPDRVQLNTVTRPPAEDYAMAVPRATLEGIAATFTPRAEVIAEFHAPGAFSGGERGRDEILNLLSRRPCSLDDIAEGLGMHRSEVLKSVEHLCRKGVVEGSPLGGKFHYKAVRPPHRPLTEVPERTSVDGIQSQDTSSPSGP
jgi:wyosine [tRNA(Phe)-imidazoG37] synthetase (radical SAM superfamily)